MINNTNLQLIQNTLAKVNSNDIKSIAIALIISRVIIYSIDHNTHIELCINSDGLKFKTTNKQTNKLGKHTMGAIQCN